jgi:hypothetical protein
MLTESTQGVYTVASKSLLKHLHLLPSKDSEGNERALRNRRKPAVDRNIYCLVRDQTSLLESSTCN